MEKQATAILELLGSSYPIAIKSKFITEQTGYNGVIVRKTINFLRSLGYPICSSINGYYLSKDKEEIEKTIHSLESRVETIQKAVEGLKLSLKDREKGLCE